MLQSFCHILSLRPPTLSFVSMLFTKIIFTTECLSIIIQRLYIHNDVSFFFIASSERLWSSASSPFSFPSFDWKKVVFVFILVGRRRLRRAQRFDILFEFLFRCCSLLLGDCAIGYRLLLAVSARITFNDRNQRTPPASVVYPDKS